MVQGTPYESQRRRKVFNDMTKLTDTLLVQLLVRVAVIDTVDRACIATSEYLNNWSVLKFEAMWGRVQQ